MNRTTLFGSIAGGLMAVAASSPAWAQAATYPDCTDRSAIQNSSSRTECMNQMDESRQNPQSGKSTDSPTSSDSLGNRPAPGSRAVGFGSAEQNGSQNGPQ